MVQGTSVYALPSLLPICLLPYLNICIHTQNTFFFLSHLRGNYKHRDLLTTTKKMCISHERGHSLTQSQYNDQIRKFNIDNNMIL